MEKTGRGLIGDGLARYHELAVGAVGHAFSGKNFGHLHDGGFHFDVARSCLEEASQHLEEVKDAARYMGDDEMMDAVNGALSGMDVLDEMLSREAFRFKEQFDSAMETMAKLLAVIDERHPVKETEGSEG